MIRILNYQNVYFGSSNNSTPMSSLKIAFLIVPLSLMLLGACRTPSPLPNSEDSIQNQVNTPPTPKIFTIILKIRNVQGSQYPLFEIYKTITAEGHLKKTSSLIDYKNENSFIAELLNAKGQVVQSFQFQNPLKKSYETTDDDGNFQRHEIEIEEEYYSLRLQQSALISQLKLYLVQRKQPILLQQIDL
jgi:hypothetical protein